MVRSVRVLKITESWQNKNKQITKEYFIRNGKIPSKKINRIYDIKYWYMTYLTRKDYDRLKLDRNNPKLRKTSDGYEMPSRHKQKMVKLLNNDYILVDAAVANIIEILNRNGYETEMSCEGNGTNRSKLYELFNNLNHGLWLNQ